jgi:hypothetical protein
MEIHKFNKGDLVKWEPGRFYYGTKGPGLEHLKSVDEEKKLGIVIEINRGRPYSRDGKLLIQWNGEHFVRIYNEHDWIELERITIAAKINLDENS